MAIGENIKRLRKMHGLNQTDLAKKINVCSSAISHYEMEKRQVSNTTLVDLSNIFNVTVDFIIKAFNYYIGNKIVQIYSIHVIIESWIKLI